MHTVLSLLIASLTVQAVAQAKMMQERSRGYHRGFNPDLLGALTMDYLKLACMRRWILLQLNRTAWCASSLITF